MRSPAVAGRLVLKTDGFICALLSLDYANSFWVPAAAPTRQKSRGRSEASARAQMSVRTDWRTRAYKNLFADEKKK